MAVDRLETFLKVLTVVCEWELTSPSTKLSSSCLQSCFGHWLPGDEPLHQVLREAAKRAGWHLPSAKIQQRQKVAARARTNQREEDLALRRILVAHVFKLLPLLRKKPSSTATAQAIIGQT